MLYLTNAFSLNMLPAGIDHAMVVLVKLDREEMAEVVGANPDFTSAIGHADTAAIVSDLLGVAVPMNRVSVRLEHPDDALLVFQFGTRLPEGTTKLPEGAALDVWHVKVPTPFVPVS